MREPPVLRSTVENHRHRMDVCTDVGAEVEIVEEGEVALCKNDLIEFMAAGW
jgi:hypothetical protein